MRLTRDEIILVSAIIVALGAGALVKHWRQSERVATFERVAAEGAVKEARED